MQPPRVPASPDPALWPGLVRAGNNWRHDAAQQFRRELGLPLSTPLILTGHQAMFWHAGIVAKYIAAGSLAHRCSFPWAAVIVDQDEPEFSPLRVPVRDERGRLAVREVPLLAAPPVPGAPLWQMPAFEFSANAALAALRAQPALPSVSQSVHDIQQALHDRRAEPDAARQVTRAALDLLGTDSSPAALMLATAIASTTLFSQIVAKLKADPLAAAQAYNRAAAARPEARLAPLRLEGPAGPELPLWLLAPGKPRRRAFANDPAPAPNELLAPRALLMTGLLRLGACELFIHGTGGGIYDTATEQWFTDWLGSSLEGWPSAALAPAVVISADLRLPLHQSEVTPVDAARAAWEAHHARHDPALVGDDARAHAKRMLVEEIAATRRARGNPLPAYLRLQALLDEYRSERAAPLTQLATRAAELKVRLAERDTATDRTYAFALHDAGSRRALIDAVRGAVSGGISPR